MPLSELVPPPPPPSKWMGERDVEVQGCDPDVCDNVRGTCPWEDCTVVNDDGKICECRITNERGESETCTVAHRFLRLKSVSRLQRPVK